MEDLNNVIEFKSNFLDMPYQRLIVWVMGCVFGFILVWLSHGHIVLILCGIVLLLMPLLFEYQTYNIRNKSFIYIKDNTIEVKVWSRRAKTYPIDCIEKVMVVDFDKDDVTANMKSFVFPVAFGQGGGDIIPQVGVLVFFKRSYIKSVYPIFFNPSDPALFAKTLTERIKND